MRNIGEEIKKARKIAGISQAELGALVGVTDRTISRYESGQIKVPEKTLEKIADALNVTLIPTHVIDVNEVDASGMMMQLNYMKEVCFSMLIQIDSMEKAIKEAMKNEA